MAPRTSTTIPDSDSPQADAIAVAVLAAYAAEGYLLENGSGKDHSKVRSRILEVVRTHKVIQWKDRADKAIRRTDVIRQVFPSLPAPPDGFSEAEDPQLAKAVWARISTEVWGHLAVSADSALQQLVGATMGNGYALVRAALDSHTPDSVYVTDNRTCIDRDLLEPEDQLLTRKITKMINLRTMLIARQPDNARHYAKSGNDQLKLAQVTGHDRLAMAVEAATSASADNGEGDEPGNGDEPGTEA